MVASFQAAYRSGSSSPTSSGSARSWWTLKKYRAIKIKPQPLCLVPDIRQNLVLKDHAFRVVLREPRFRGILVCEHLEVIRVANLLAGVDVDKSVIGLSSASACPSGIACPIPAMAAEVGPGHKRN